MTSQNNELAQEYYDTEVAIVLTKPTPQALYLRRDELVQKLISGFGPYQGTREWKIKDNTGDEVRLVAIWQGGLELGGQVRMKTMELTGA